MEFQLNFHLSIYKKAIPFLQDIPLIKNERPPNVTTQRCTKQTKSVTNMSDGVVKSLKRNIALLTQN